MVASMQYLPKQGTKVSNPVSTIACTPILRYLGCGYKRPVMFNVIMLLMNADILAVAGSHYSFTCHQLGMSLYTGKTSGHYGLHIHPSPQLVCKFRPPQYSGHSKPKSQCEFTPEMRPPQYSGHLLRLPLIMNSSTVDPR
jgi:hypothetical protein